MRTQRSFTCFYLFLAGVLFFGSSLLQGQTISLVSGTANFGSVNVCTPGSTVPAPCSATETLTYKVTAGGTLGTPKVVTGGAPNLDFTLAGGTCSGIVTTGANCTVQAKFAPKYAGVRAGAVEIVDGNGKVLATTFVYGKGLGPQIAFDGAAPILVNFGTAPQIFWQQVTVDELGNLYLLGTLASTNVYGTYELPAGGGALKSLGAGVVPVGIAVDGAGTVYVTDSTSHAIVEIPAGCAISACQTVLNLGLNSPTSLVVDSDGTIYVADYEPSSGNNPTDSLLKVAPGCASSACVVVVESQIIDFAGPLALDHAGNLLYIDQAGTSFEKLSLAGGAPVEIVEDTAFVTGITVDGGGNVFFSEVYDERVYKLPPGCTMAACGTVIAGNLSTPVDVSVDSAGDLFLLISGSPTEYPRSQPPLYTFATTNVDTVSSDSPILYTASNGGNASLSLAGVNVGTVPNFEQVAGPGTPADCHAGTVLATGAGCDLSITFSPASGEPLMGEATFTDNSLNATDGVQTIPLAGTGVVPGTPINYPGGFGGTAPTFFSLNGGTAVDGTSLELTDGGQFEERSAFFLKRVGIANFQTSFDFKLTGKGKPTPDADGFTFVLQANGPNAVGSGGSGLGYGPPALGLTGPKITNSVAIKFDLHNNNGEGSSSTGLYINGSSPTVPAVNLLPSSIDLHSGHSFHVTLGYDGTTLTLTITDMTTNATFTQPFTVDIPAALGGPSAYAGFTASTGETTAVQEIQDWKFSVTTCCNAGEPTYPDGFADTSLLSVYLNGMGSLGSSTLQLAQNTPFEDSFTYFANQVPVNKFTSDFDFQFSAGDGDGFTFVVQNDNVHTLGSFGGGLGYGPATPGGPSYPFPPLKPSVAVKFDLHNNAGEGPNSTGVYENGASPTVPSTDLSPSRIDFHLGHTFHARLTYDGTNLTVNITDLTDYTVFTQSYPVDIPAVVGGTTAFAGFTAATGATASTMNLLNWEMTSY